MSKRAFMDVRMVMTVSVLTMAILTAYVVGDFFARRGAIVQELTQVASHTSDRLSKQLVSPLWSIDNQLIDITLNGEMDRYELSAVEILDTKKEKVLFEKTRLTSMKLGALVTGEVISESRDIITENGENIGSVKVTISQEYIQQKLYNGIKQAGLNALLLSVSLIVLYMFIADRLLLRPVRKISDVIKSMEQGDLQNPINIKQGNDIGELAQSVKALQEKLRLT